MEHFSVEECDVEHSLVLFFKAKTTKISQHPLLSSFVVVVFESCSQFFLEFAFSIF